MWLLAQILIYLILAFLIGGVGGWLLRGRHAQEAQLHLQERFKQMVSSIEMERDAARLKARDLSDRLEALQASRSEPTTLEAESSPVPPHAPGENRSAGAEPLSNRDAGVGTSPSGRDQGPWEAAEEAAEEAALQHDEALEEEVVPAGPMPLDDEVTATFEAARVASGEWSDAPEEPEAVPEPAGAGSAEAAPAPFEAAPTPIEETGSEAGTPGANPPPGGEAPREPSRTGADSEPARAPDEALSDHVEPGVDGTIDGRASEREPHAATRATGTRWELVEEPETPAPKKRRAAPAATSDQGGRGARPLSHLGEIPPLASRKLRAMGIEDTSALHRHFANGTDPAELAAELGVETRRVRRWKTLSELLELPSVEAPHAWLLEIAGVASLKELAVEDAAELTQRMVHLNRDQALGLPVPDQARVAAWVEGAEEGQRRG